jgi:hypothetical protein
VVFESDAGQLLSLCRLQDLLLAEFPAAIVRMKGMLRFAEDPATEYTMHLSGRRRFEATPGPITVPGGRSHFVVIFRNDGTTDAARIRALLDRLVEPTVVDDGDRAVIAQGLSSQWHDAKQLLDNDGRFEVYERTQHSTGQAAGLDRVLLFRLTNAIASRLSLFELQHSYGVQFDAMNKRLMRNANASAGGLCFLTTRVMPSIANADESNAIVAADGQTAATTLWLQFALGGNVTFSSIWPALLAALAPVVEWCFRNVPRCYCRF